MEYFDFVNTISSTDTEESFLEKLLGYVNFPREKLTSGTNDFRGIAFGTTHKETGYKLFLPDIYLTKTGVEESESDELKQDYTSFREEYGCKEFSSLAELISSGKIKGKMEREYKAYNIKRGYDNIRVINWRFKKDDEKKRSLIFFIADLTNQIGFL